MMIGASPRRRRRHALKQTHQRTRPRSRRHGTTYRRSQTKNVSCQSLPYNVPLHPPRLVVWILQVPT